ncbi:MAG TPA: molybdopterin-dependent oxidoreductase [Candidatus Limnocylindrales bacterium]|nr:molybdopterin-dependent oxidoreductase [Candidatus Limnocylindrales bacterium]
MSEWKSTACILCECNCGIEVQLGGEDGRRLVKFRGDDAHPASRGYACEKPHRLDFYQNGPHRLTKPLRRRADGTFEEIDWDTAIREVAARFAAIRDEHGGETIFYYGGGGQGNHLPGVYGPATRSLLGSMHSANALSQEKTGEFWVATKMVGGYSRGSFENCEVGFFLGKNPWFSHGIPRARVTLREIAKDPARTLIVVDPRVSETAEMADIHLQVKPGGDAFLLAAMIAVIVQEGLVKKDWLAAHADGLEQVLPHFTSLDIAVHAEKSGVPEEQLRSAARRIAAAKSMATFEDLGVQMNLHSTLVSYLHKLLVLLTGNFGKEGAEYRPSTLVPQAFNGEEFGTTPVTGSKIIGGLTPCNVVPDEILTDHPKRFRAMLVESGNPAHSIADGVRMREALAALDLVVVIDVAFTETARLADYVLPVASQFEKAEAVFFNFEFPNNYFFLRKALMPPLHGLFSEAELHARLAEALGALPRYAVEALREAWMESRVAFRTKFFELLSSDDRLGAIAPVLVYRAIGDLLPEGLAEGAGVWAICQLAAPRIAPSLARAGYAGSPPEAADALFDAMLTSKSAITFSVDEWEESFARVYTPNGRIQLAIPELFDELDGLASEPERTSPEFPLVLSAGERRSFTANTIIRNPEWRKKDRAGALRMHPDDAMRAGVTDGGRVRLSTRRGSAETVVEFSDRMRPGHISLPNGLGLDYPGENDECVATGVSPNELTRSEDRDWLAGTPWHKHTPARVDAL